MVCGKPFSKSHETHFCIPSRATITDIAKMTITQRQSGCKHMNIPFNPTNTNCKKCIAGDCGFEKVPDVIKFIPTQKNNMEA